MNPDIAVSLVSKGLELALVISAPVLIAGLAVGLLVSIFQAVTQIQEMTLSFIPKIIVMVVLIGVTFPWMLSTLMEYTVALIQNMNTYVGKYKVYILKFCITYLNYIFFI